MARPSRIVSGPQLAKRRFAGVDLPGIYGDLLGEPPPDVYGLVHGPAGSGKSTFTLGLADAWAGAVAPALYVAAEEGISKSLRDRAVRIGANSPRLHFTTFEGFAAVLADARAVQAGLVVLDSISSADPHSRGFADFAKAAKSAGFALVLVAHETKAGKHRGSSSLAYDPAVIVAVRGGVAETMKNRHAPLTAVDVDFGAADRRANPACDCAACPSCGGVVRSNPPHSGACAHASGDACSCSCNGRLHRSGITHTVGKVKTAGKQSGSGRAAMAAMTGGGSKKVVGGARVVRRGAGSRANPVPTPFGVTFAEIAKTHAIRGAAKLNKLVGFESPALIDFADEADRLPKGQRLETMVERAERAQMAFAWKSRSRDEGNGQRTKKGVLTVVVFTESSDPDLFEVPDGTTTANPWSRDGRVYEFPAADFAGALVRFLKVFGTTRVAIYDQYHAKLVLGAAEYRRQEKASAPPKARTTAPRKPRVTVKPKVVAKSKAVRLFRKGDLVSFTERGMEMRGTVDMDQAREGANVALYVGRVPTPGNMRNAPPSLLTLDVSSAPLSASTTITGMKEMARAPKRKTSPAPRKTSAPKRKPVVLGSNQTPGAGDMAAFDSGMASLENLLARAIQ